MVAQAGTGSLSNVPAAEAARPKIEYPLTEIAELALLWAAFFMLTLLRRRFNRCSWGFAAAMAAEVAVCVASAMLFIHQVGRRARPRAGSGFRVASAVLFIHQVGRRARPRAGSGFRVAGAMLFIHQVGRRARPRAGALAADDACAQVCWRWQWWRGGTCPRRVQLRAPALGERVHAQRVERHVRELQTSCQLMHRVSTV
jgi:hypothetical protein